MVFVKTKGSHYANDYVKYLLGELLPPLVVLPGSGDQSWAFRPSDTFGKPKKKLCKRLASLKKERKGKKIGEVGLMEDKGLKLGSWAQVVAASSLGDY